MPPQRQQLPLPHPSGDSEDVEGLTLHEKANGTSLDGEGIQAWLEWEAMRWRVPVEISRTELEALVNRSSVVLEREKHRLVHESDWRRWGRITATELEAARVSR